MYHIVICDDEKEILNTITQRIKQSFEHLSLEACYTMVSDSRSLAKMVEEQPLDIVFLDIDMPYFDGMDIAKMITDRGAKTLLVFVTSYDALVYQTFAYRPFGFIRKSHFEQEVDEVAERLAAELMSRNETYVIQKGAEVVQFLLEDIFYIESSGNYVEIVAKNGRERYRDTLASLEEKLSTRGFVRCHKGYVVNLKCIHKISSSEIALSNGVTIPIGRNYEKEVKQRLLELMRR